MSPEEGHKMEQLSIPQSDGDGATLLWWKAEEAGAIQPGEGFRENLLQ